MLRSACPERHEILPLLRRVRMTRSEGLAMTKRSHCEAQSAEAISNGNCMGLLRGACPERHEILPLLRRVRMTGSEGLAMIL